MTSVRNKATLLLAGPIATGAIVTALFLSGSLNPTLLPAAMAAAAFLWSPLPVSLAAVICNNERAEAGSGLGVFKKAVYLYPRMWRNDRVVTESHLLGFGILTVCFVVSVLI